MYSNATTAEGVTASETSAADWGSLSISIGMSIINIVSMIITHCHAKIAWGSEASWVMYVCGLVQMGGGLPIADVRADRLDEVVIRHPLDVAQAAVLGGAVTESTRISSIKLASQAAVDSVVGQAEVWGALGGEARALVLMWAARTGNIAALETLLDSAGTDVNAVDKAREGGVQDPAAGGAYEQPRLGRVRPLLERQSAAKAAQPQTTSPRGDPRLPQELLTEPRASTSYTRARPALPSPCPRSRLAGPRRTTQSSRGTPTSSRCSRRLVRAATWTL